MTIVAPSADYESLSDTVIPAERIDLLGRMMSMQRPHPAYALTGAMCTAAAAAIPGTIVREVCRQGADFRRLRIGHPGGVLEAGVECVQGPGGPLIQSAYGFRTARLLMKGIAYY
jgi:2-methylaconitate cis-trans-isomerase PrpF